jgi:hypothetical protein
VAPESGLLRVLLSVALILPLHSTGSAPNFRREAAGDHYAGTAFLLNMPF